MRSLSPAEGVADVGGEGAGEAHVEVGADEREFDAAGDLPGGPVLAVEAVGAAVQGIAVVVGAELVDLAIEVEAGERDAVAVASDDGAHVGLGVGEVAVERVVAEHDIRFGAVPVRRLN